jgi:ACS family allantoate permease-like MFS transporter
MVSLIGSVMVRYGPNLGSNLLGVFIFIGYVAGIPLSLSMISSNVAGFTKKAVAS